MRRTRNKLIVFLFILSVCPASALAQYITDLEIFRLKGHPKRVLEYKIESATKDRPFRTKNLLQIMDFDKAGNRLETIYLTRGPDESHYQREVFGYDKKGRNISIETFKSANVKAEDLLLPDVTEKGIIKLNPNLKETLVQRNVYKYNEKNHYQEYSQQMFLEDKVYRTKYNYDYEKRETTEVHTENGALVSESKTFRIADGWQWETIYYKGSKLYRRQMNYYNKKNELIHEEVFEYRLAANREDINQVIKYERFERRNGNQLEVEQLQFDELGKATSKSLTIYENNLERLEAFYKAADKSSNPKWLFDFQIKKEYQFDEQGSWTKMTSFVRDAPDDKFIETEETGRVITYY